MLVLATGEQRASDNITGIVKPRPVRYIPAKSTQIGKDSAVPEEAAPELISRHIRIARHLTPIVKRVSDAPGAPKLPRPTILYYRVPIGTALAWEAPLLDSEWCSYKRMFLGIVLGVWINGPVSANLSASRLLFR